MGMGNYHTAVYPQILPVTPAWLTCDCSSLELETAALTQLTAGAQNITFRQWDNLVTLDQTLLLLS